MKTTAVFLLLCFLFLCPSSSFARKLVPGYFLAHSGEVAFGLSGEGMEMWVDAEGYAYAICGDFYAEPVIKGSVVNIRFDTALFYVGVMNPEGTAVRGRLIRYSPGLKKKVWVRRFNMRITDPPNKIVLTRMTVYGGQTNGAAPSGEGGYINTYYANTLGWFGDDDYFLWNAFLFAPLHGGRLFFNSGNTGTTLNPNLRLGPGTRRVHFVTPYEYIGPLGIRLYFNNSRANHITAFVPTDGSSSFRAAPAGDILDGEPTTGSLSFTNGNTRVTLTDLRFEKYADLSWEWYLEPDGNLDTIGNFQVKVEPVASQ